MNGIRWPALAPLHNDNNDHFETVVVMIMVIIKLSGMSSRGTQLVYAPAIPRVTQQDLRNQLVQGGNITNVTFLLLTIFHS